jgi:hypothetical protein
VSSARVDWTEYREPRHHDLVGAHREQGPRANLQINSRNEILPTYKVVDPSVCAPTSSVEVIRALSTPEVASRIDAAVKALDQIPASSISERPESRQQLRLGHRTLRREILAVLEESSEALRPLEVRVRVEQRLGMRIKPHKVVASLNNGAHDPTVPIVRVSRGRYHVVR